MTLRKESEGLIPVDIPNAGKPCKIWFKIVGDVRIGVPLITLHGGPGAAHEYMLPFIDLHKKHNKTIIFYDQVGCGKSTRLPEKNGDGDFWTFELFMHELDTLVDHLGLRSQGFDLLGHSWGGMLGGVYAAKKPEGLRKLVLADAPSSIPLMLKGEQKLIDSLPQDVRDVIEECHRNGDFDSEKYKNACVVFYQRHLCRADPWPKDLQTGLGHLEEDPTVYRTMWGPSEFFASGSLKNWEGHSTAHHIGVETLLINGRYDEVQDLAVAPWFHRIPKVKWVQLENSSHMGHFEERERYMQFVGDFLEGDHALN
ncbi:proline-specific peptidase [Periconia macrospinosa]|uniref:Proline-specific peptidase n=1 Tax=Periconia macrospinosa TaxID=97972 RepID=A0A2V1E5P7_9PLEO|nr:proline-specific peptidase [Periconia macrospinosa]